MPPCAGETIEDLFGGVLRTGQRSAFVVEELGSVLVVLGDSGLAKVLGHHDVQGDLAPLRRDLGVGHLKDNRAVGVGDSGVTSRPLQSVVWVVTGLGKATGYP